MQRGYMLLIYMEYNYTIHRLDTFPMNCLYVIKQFSYATLGMSVCTPIFKF